MHSNRFFRTVRFAYFPIDVPFSGRSSTQLERYALIKRLGTGTYGSVFEGKDASTGEAVAIKVIEKDPMSCAVQGFPIAIIREAALLKSLKHVNVVELKDVVLSQTNAYLVMNLCHCDLRKHLIETKRSGRHMIETQQLKSILHQILAAVSYCHDRRVLHRDLKPDNILLDQGRGIVTVADFGMARLFVPNQKLSDQCVTAWYRCPEIILGDSYYATPIDIWSTACIFAEMMNLEPVFQCMTEVGCLIKIFQNLGTPNESVWPGVSSLPYFNPSFPCWSSQPAISLVNEDAVAKICPGALDLLEKMLQLNPKNRISASAALNNAYFTSGVVDSSPGPVALVVSRGNETCKNSNRCEVPPSGCAMPDSTSSAQSTVSGQERRRSKRICRRDQPKPNQT